MLRCFKAIHFEYIIHLNSGGFSVLNNIKFTKSGMLSFDIYLLIGASIIAYQKLNRHIVALEEDEAIFKAILHLVV